VKRWFLVSALVGLAVGLFVTALQALITLVWHRIQGETSLILVVLAPTIGLALSGAFLQRMSKNPTLQGTEEYTAAYHGSHVFRFRSFPGKVLAAFSTLALGGSAGLEGPSIYAGGAIGAYVVRRLGSVGLTEEDIRHLMVAGGAAGISAIFKTPLTGIVFALEVPYRDDLVRGALIPSLVASVTSYLVLVQFLGTRPLFAVMTRPGLSIRDLFWSVVVGLVVGVGARVFIASYHRFTQLWRRIPAALWIRTMIGGFVTGLFGLASMLVFGYPAALGPGYESVSGLLSGQLSGWQAIVLLVLKSGAVLATLCSGAAGGIFIPMIVIGASFGSAVGGFVPDGTGPLFPIVGMSAFLAAGYNTPLSAAVFIAESTGGAGYLIPGLIGGAVAYAVAGKTSVSTEQRWRRESRLERLMAMEVGSLMTRHVVSVKADTPVDEFVTRDVTNHGHKSLPVTDEQGRLVGMVGLSDVQRFPRHCWTDITMGEVMSTEVFVVEPHTTVGAMAAEMAARDISRVPVVAADDARRLVGIISSTDLLSVSDLAERP
jgi:chloride channel protein, CIC family